MEDILFRDLDAQEVEEFKQWAREYYSVGDDVSELWHPIVREECRLMNEEDRDEEGWIDNHDESPEESDEEIADYENHVIDSQEDRTI